MSSLDDVMRSADAVAVPDLWPRIMAGTRRAPRDSAGWRRLLLSAAALAIVAASVVLLVRAFSGHDRPIEQPTAPACLGTAAGCASHTPARSVSPPSSATPTDHFFSPEFVGFWDEDHGIVAGSWCGRHCAGRIEQTSDGGRTWNVVVRTRQQLVSGTVGPGADAWVSAECTASRCDGPLLHSSDFGLTWHRVGTSIAQDPVFLSSTVGFAVQGPFSLLPGPGGRLIRTSDGGVSWHPVSGQGRGYVTISFTDAQHGWMYRGEEPSVGQQSKAVSMTSDGGLHFRLVAADLVLQRPTRRFGGLTLTGYVRGIAMLPDGHGWLWNTNEGPFLMRTSDGGRNWTAVAQPSADVYIGVLDLSALSDTQAYALVWGAGSTQLWLTRDGGATWAVLNRWAKPH